MTADEASKAMEACRAYLENELPRLREEDNKVAELGAIESGSEMLSSSEDVSRSTDSCSGCVPRRSSGRSRSTGLRPRRSVS